jgi:hypothetical protein
MSFVAYTVKHGGGKYHRMTIGGIATIFFSCVFVAFNIALFLLILAAGFTLIVVGVLKGGDKAMAYYIDKNEILSLDEDEIKVGIVVYPMNEITDLKFYYHSFYSQSPRGYYTDTGMVEYGISNNVSFVYIDQKKEFRFYLPNKKQADKFFRLIEEFKESGVQYQLKYRNPNFAYYDPI